MFRSQQKRISLALQNARSLGIARDRISEDCSEKVFAGLRKKQVVLTDGDVVVTEAGFVTMAVCPSRATDAGHMLAVPGVDDCGQEGYLVIRDGMPPYHSLASDPWEAIAEAQISVCKSNDLLAVFGKKSVMVDAVSRAPAFLPSTVTDFENSGLCLWGAESFLRRLGMLSLARRFGLPRFLLRLSGPYGVRLTAATMIRRGLWEKRGVTHETA